MESTIADVFVNLLATGLGAAMAYSTQHVRAKMKKQATKRRIGDFFGKAGEKILIIHSSIYDEPEHAYNYPATDTRAVRILAQFFEKANLREGIDFAVLPDRRVSPDSLLREHNVVALCGPARNSCYRTLVPTPSPVRYEMAENTNPNGRGNQLIDNLTDARLYSSRQKVSELGVAEDSHFDFGLVVSMPNYRNPSKRLIILAGIHGAGTVGAAEFVADSEHLKLLNRRRDGGSVCEVVQVKYAEGDNETPTEVKLV